MRLIVASKHFGTALIVTLLGTAGLAACGDDSSESSNGMTTSMGGGGGTISTGGTGGKANGSAGQGGGAAGSSAGMGGTSGSGTGGTTAGVTQTKAADLRALLNEMLGEHMIFAAKATDAALGGRNGEFNAYGALLNSNGTDLGAAIGSVYGDAAKAQFNEIWSAHNGFFVDYTVGVATNDKAKQDKAVSDLMTQYVPNFSNLISAATGIDKKAVTDLVTMHVTMTKMVVDDQAAALKSKTEADWTKTYADLRASYAHMRAIGDPVSEAIAAQHADVLPGDAKAKGVDLRVALDLMLEEHLFLASAATGAALGGRTEEFKGAAAALNANGTDLGAAIGSVYGDAAKAQFNEIWSAHNGFFVDYTVGVVTNDKAKQDKAVSDLTTQYVPQFTNFLNGATDIPKETLSTLITDHVLTTKAIVDAQAAQAADAASKDATAAQHMRMIGDPLAAAIVAKVPGKF